MGKWKFVEDDLRSDKGPGRMQTIDNLEGALTKAYNQMMPVWQHSCGCAMGCCGIWQFLG